MKIDPRGIAGFLRAPGRARVVLIHGEDEGLVRERAEALTRVVAGSLNDPFLTTELQREAWPQIAGEMAALSMIGGRRVVRVREVTDAILPFVQAALKTPGEALLILEAPSLGKGKLRTFAETSADAAAIACYVEEGRALDDFVRGLLAAERITADQDALAWLGETLGGDRSVVRGEVEKLILLAGPGGRLDLDMAQSCAGDAYAASFDEALRAATAGDVPAADAATEAAIADGLAPIALLRATLSYLQKLHQARLFMATGASAADAVGAMRPPVFFRAKAATAVTLQRWPEDALMRAIAETRDTELSCKQTGARQELLARRLISTLARQGQARRRASEGRAGL